MFFMSLVFVCFVCAMWTIYRVIGQSSRPISQKILIGIAFLITFFIPVLLKDRGPYEGFFFNLFYHTAYFAFIVAALFFCLIAMRDGIWIIGWLYEKFKHSEKHRFAWKQPAMLAKTNRILFVIAAVIAVYGLYEGLKTPDIKETIIETNHVEKPITIVALSDLHLHRTMQQGKINHIVGAVNKLSPDLIVLPGDTVDDEPRRIQDLLAELKKLKSRLGIYATAGNHEFYVGHEKSKKALENVGVTYLYNEGVALKDNLYLAGVPDTQSVKRISDSVDVPKALNSATDKEYKILLSHTPSLIDKIQDQKVDLQISGHTHGGQIFPFHIVSWILNKYLAGLYSVGNSSLYVSRGSGQWGPQIRVLARSEISVIKLVPENKKASDQSEKQVDKNKTADKKTIDSQGKPKLNKAEEVKKKEENIPSLDKKDDIHVNDKKNSDSKPTENINRAQTENKKTDNSLGNNEATRDKVTEKKTDSIQPSDKEVKSSNRVSLENKTVEKKLLMAQMEADQEASLKTDEKKENNKTEDVPSEKEKVLSTEDKAFEEAKAQMDAEFEKVLTQQKALAEKQAEVQKLAAQNEKELALKAEAQEKELRAELEKVKSEAEQALVAQKEALKTVENEKKIAQEAIEAQKKLAQQLATVQKELEAQKEKEVATQKELKALQEKQLKAAKEESVLSNPVLANSTEKGIQKEPIKGSTEQIISTAQKIVDKTEKFAQKPQLILPGHPSGSKEVLSQNKTKFEPIPLEKNRAGENNTVEKRIDPSAIMRITTHPDGSVTRTIVRTRIQETATQIKTIKTVTSYTSSPAEERARGRKTLQDVLNNLPPVNTEQLIQQLPSTSHRLVPAGEGVQPQLIPTEKSVKSVSEAVPSTQMQNVSVQHLGIMNSVSTIPPALEKALSEPRVPPVLPVRF